MLLENIAAHTHFGPAPVAFATPDIAAGSTILFVIGRTGRPVASLVRTATLARRMASRLVLLAVGGVHARRRRHAAREGSLIETWARRIVPWATVETVRGDMRSAVKRVSDQVAARLIVVPRSELTRPSEAIALAHACGAPVLVARPAAGSDAVLAASDLRDPRAPVVRTAAEIAGHFGAPLLVVHNDVLGLGASPRLRDVLGSIGVPAEALVVSAPRTSDAVLEEARAREVDLLVVGSRVAPKRSSTGVAGEVLERARRSVLVMPLGEPAAGVHA